MAFLYFPSSPLFFIILMEVFLKRTFILTGTNPPAIIQQCAMSQRRPSVRPPGADWKDSYFTLDERYRQLQQKFNEKEKELQRAKVAERRASGAASLNRARASLRGRGRGGRGRGRLSPPRESLEGESFADASVRSEPLEVNTDYVRLPSVAGPDAARAGLLSDASMWGPESMLPDPAMIWGAEGSIQNYVAASALYHANEDLRRKMEESTTVIKTLQQELSTSRTAATNLQGKLEDCTQRMHQLVRERDLMTQKYESAKSTITDFERTVQNRISEENKIKFSLESQVTDLRSRLVAGADNNELLSRDVRTLLSETRDKTGELMALRSKLALLESSYRSQKSTNENLLIELKNLNSQLIHERKKLVFYARDLQTAAIQQDRVAEVEEKLKSLTDERNDLERSYVKLMADFVQVTENALRHAREEVRQDLQDWREAATHWEDVSQLLYKDIAQRTQNHIQCRAECEEAMAQRDSAVLALKTAKETLGLCQAKLRVVWPSHESDTTGLTEEEILSTFGIKNRFRVRVTKKTADGAAEGVDKAEREMGETEPMDPPALLDFSGAAAGDTEEEGDGYAEVLLDLPYDPATKGERVRELHEANAGLMAELAQMRLSNELLQTRIESLTGRRNEELVELEQRTKSLEKREAASQRLLDNHLDRVQFLESQVQSLRGYSVEKGASLDTLAVNENVFELFLGQLVAQEVPAEVPVPEMFSAIFFTADFLLHETVTSPTVNGLNGFFDTTISFQIAMDALLLYYLQYPQLARPASYRVRRGGEGGRSQLVRAVGGKRSGFPVGTGSD
ncbi:hypothetical protein AGDE_06155 [Angomonas deanei]|nr:hypothetical protein AGDE_06155 [Angomonas deanei]|eukprot:EPY37779.1 hypothetical protein AGDE_06155 [Angomonas deanei]